MTTETQFIIDVAACIDAQGLSIDPAKMKEAKEHIEQTIHGYIGDYLADLLRDAGIAVTGDGEEENNEQL